MNRLRRFGLLLLALAAAGCAKRAQLPPMPQDAQRAIDQAVADMDAKKYGKAEDEFTFIIFNFPGSHQASDAQFYLAESYFRSKDYVQAQSEFDFYIKTFPNGRFQEDATYKLAVSYLRSAPGPVRDQTRTLKAREIVSQFLETYPDSPFRAQAEQLRGEIGERLALRQFDAARLYFNSGEYKSALVYYRVVNDSFPAERWPGMERYRFAYSLLQTGDTTGGRAILSELVAGDCEPAVKKLASAALARTH